MINSRFLNGMTIEQAKEEVARLLETATLPSSARPHSPSKTGVNALMGERVGVRGFDRIDRA